MHERTSQNASYSLVQGCCRTCKKNMAPMGGRPFGYLYLGLAGPKNNLFYHKKTYFISQT